MSPIDHLRWSKCHGSIPNVTDWSLEMAQVTDRSYMSQIDHLRWSKCHESTPKCHRLITWDDPNVTDRPVEMAKCHILNQIYTSNIETRDFCRSMSIGTDVTLSTMSRPAKCPQCHNLAISLTQISTMLTFGWERFDRKVKGNIFKLSGVKSIPHTFVSSWSFGKNLPRYLTAF